MTIRRSAPTTRHVQMLEHVWSRGRCPEGALLLTFGGNYRELLGECLESRWLARREDAITLTKEGLTVLRRAL